jgi:hypothetical protein
MNEESRPARRLPNHDLREQPTRLGGCRAWRREINRLPDDELIRVVRGMVSVDHAVNTYRREGGQAVFLPPTQTRTT